MSEKMWDLMTNLDLSPGRSGCSLSLDVLLTPDGDLAIVSGEDELKQRFILYRATPKGERLDPTLGCTEYDYLHEKNTNNEMRKMAQDIYTDCSRYFPELKARSILCEKSPDDEYSVRVLSILAENNIEFLFNPKSLMTISSTLDNILHQVFRWLNGRNFRYSGRRKY